MVNAFPFDDRFFRTANMNAIGFNRIVGQLEGLWNEDRTERQETYPPYNIINTGEDTFRIEVAVAGFSKEEINVEVKEQTLTVSGEKNELETKIKEESFVHKGIGTRKFQRTFKMADYVEVIEADILNGVLTIECAQKIPEAQKPRKIVIGSGAENTQDKKKELLTEKTENINKFEELIGN